MKLNEKKLTEGVHAGLLEVLAAEGLPGKETDDTRVLAARLVEVVKFEGSGKSLPGRFDRELENRAFIICSQAEVDHVKGRGQRLARAVLAYQRALSAAVSAVQEAGE